MTQTVQKELAEAGEVCPTTSQRLLAESALLVDVREAAEVAQVGYSGCEVVNIPVSEFEAHWVEVPCNRDVILACAVGERNLKATYFLMYQGYERVMNMRPGNGRWVDHGFSITGSAAGVAASEGASSCCRGAGEAAPQASVCCGNATQGSCC
ncbi:MAG: rhodanese-like domain-containing protein [Loktanella sp.]|nr:rhodanese-like domain-containing protein [Loktanella sp.]